MDPRRAQCVCLFIYLIFSPQRASLLPFPTRVLTLTFLLCCLEFFPNQSRRCLNWGTTTTTHDLREITSRWQMIAGFILARRSPDWKCATFSPLRLPGKLEEKPTLSILAKCWCDAQNRFTRYSLTWCSVDGGKERRDTVRMKAVPSVTPVWKTESVTPLYVIRFDVKPFSACGGDEALREISSGKL